MLSAKWNGVIAEMFGNSVSTSLDYPDLHRKVVGRGPAQARRSGRQLDHAASLVLREPIPLGMRSGLTNRSLGPRRYSGSENCSTLSASQGDVIHVR